MTAIVKQADTLPQKSPDFAGIIDKAIEKQLPAAELEKLLGVYERMQDREAAKSFIAAKAAFQKECPMIARTKTANIATKSGAKYSYQYADLQTIDVETRVPLATYGLSYSFSTESVDRNAIIVTCRLSHVAGHSELTTVPMPIEAGTGVGMSEQQKVAAAMTFGRRQALVQALGLTLCDPDFDGAGAPCEPCEPISKEQAYQINDLLIVVADSNKDFERRFFDEWINKSFGADTIAEIPFDQFEVVMKKLETKKGKQK